MEPLRSYYSKSLQYSCPLQIWNAFETGSYSSILDLTEYDGRLRRSCTLMMTLVEERRATRAFGGKLECDIQDSAFTGKYLLPDFQGARHAYKLLEDIVDSTELVNKTDYGSFTNLESSHGAPIQNFVRLGPDLSVSASS